MRKTRSFLLVVASLVALLAVPARSMAAGDGTLLGFTDDLVRMARAAPAVQGTSQVARITIFWRGVAAGVHGVNWLEVDRAVDAARASGQRVLFTVYGVQAPDLGEWAAFLRAMHERYPDMWAVQAWNEPNLANIGGNISVEEAAAIVMTAHEALPGVPLIGPSISPTVDGAAAYQHALYGLLPDDIGVAVNLYTYRDNNTIPDVVDNFRTAKADGGDAPVYVTEIGFHGS